MRLPAFRGVNRPVRILLLIGGLVVVGAGVAAAVMIGGIGLPNDPKGSPGPGITTICRGAGADGWAFTTVVSPNDGLVLQSARLGPRVLARSVSVPYLDIKADWDGNGKYLTKRAELVGEGEGHASAGLLTSRLLGASCQNAGPSIGAAATYAISGLPDGIDLWVMQSYRFGGREKGCEPSEKLPCTRFWPTVMWGAEQGDRKFIKSVRIVQRLDFQPDAGDAIRANLFRDNGVSQGFKSGGDIVKTLGDGHLRKAVRAKAIDEGRRNGSSGWDSVHITDRDDTGSPQAIGNHPGCSECVHTHWSWSDVANVPGCLKKRTAGCLDDFTDGSPELLTGSKQTAYLAVVRGPERPNQATEDELDPWQGDPNGDDSKSGYRRIVNSGKKIDDTSAVLYWDSTSSGAELPKRPRTQDDEATIDSKGDFALRTPRTFQLGDAIWPQLRSKRHGGNGAMFFAPAREMLKVSGFAYSAQWPAAGSIESQRVPRLDDRMPEGYVLPVRVSGGCAEHSKGPFYLSVTTATGQRLLNPENTYVATPGGLPYLAVRSDKLVFGTPSAFVPGAVLPKFHCDRNQRQEAWVYPVFAVPPTKYNVSVKLVGAPDSDQNFVPFEELDYQGASHVDQVQVNRTVVATDNGRPSACAGRRTVVVGLLGSVRLLGSVGDVECLTAVRLDLDGNGKPDYLLVYTTRSERGAVAYLDDGKVQAVSNADFLIEQDHLSWSSYFDQPHDLNGPLAVLQIAPPREQVLVGYSEGAHGVVGVLIGLTPSGELRLLDDGQRVVRQFLPGKTIGCVGVNGQRYLVEGLSGRGLVGQQEPNVPGYGRSETYYELTAENALIFRGYRGQVAEENQLPPATNSCGPTVADEMLPTQWATSPAGAVTGLINTAVANDTERGAPFVGGAYGDFSGASGGTPDVWAFLTRDSKVSARALAGRPVMCDANNTCTVASSDKRRTISFKVVSVEQAWVVASAVAIAPPRPQNQQFAYLTSVDTAKRTVTFDLVQYFTGAAAQKKCAEDPQQHPCFEYYIVNTSKRLRTMRVDGDAYLSMVNLDTAPPSDVEASLAQIATGISHSHDFYAYTANATSITDLREVYLQ
jgi:hypothetical protein